MTTLAEFNNRAHKEVIILAEICPKQALSNWISGSPSTTYSVAFDNFVATDVDSMYRTILSVRVDADALTSVANQAAVDANAGTYFYDEPNKLLYVQLSDSSAPDDATIVYAEFCLYFATRGVVFNNIYYNPRLTEEGLPTIVEGLEDLLFGIVKQVGSGTLNLTNADGVFDKISVEFSWKNSRINLLYGGDDMDLADYASIGKYTIEDFTPDFDKVAIFIRDIQKKTLKLVPSTPLIKTHTADDGTPEADDFPNMDESKDGAFMPMLCGDVSGLGPIRIDGAGVAGTTNTYLIADFNIQTLYSIDNVYNDGIQINNSFIQASLTGCTFSITAGYSGVTYGVITCDAKGPPVTGAAWETSTDYLKFSGEIIADMYTRYAGLAATDLDAASYVLSDIENDAQQALYVETQQTLRHHIKKIERGVLGRVVRNAEGLLSMNVWTPSTAQVEVPHLINPDVSSLDIDLRIESIFSKIIIRYGQAPASGAWKSTIRLDDRTRHLHLNGSHVERVVETALINADDAAALSSRIMFLTKNTQKFVRIKETGTNLWTVSPGDRIIVSLDRAPSESGVWDQKIMEIVSVTRSFGPPSIELVLNDLWGSGDQSGIWVGPGVLDWATATTDEKERSGFWTTNTGFADASDATSSDVSIWW